MVFKTTVFREIATDVRAGVCSIATYVPSNGRVSLSATFIEMPAVVTLAASDLRNAASHYMVYAMQLESSVLGRRRIVPEFNRSSTRGDSVITKRQWMECGNCSDVGSIRNHEIDALRDILSCIILILSIVATRYGQ